MLSASHELCLNFLQIMSQRIRSNNKIVCEEQYHIRRMEEYAKVDPMTGLHNRRWLEEMYTREMTRSNKGNFLLTAFMLDIDHFKNVNAPTATSPATRCLFPWHKRLHAA